MLKVEEKPLKNTLDCEGIGRMRTDREMFNSCSLEKTWKIIRENLEGLTLDVGSGDGLIVAPHRNVVGLDIEKTESYIPLVLGDMHHLPFKNKTFDTITILQVLEHSDKPRLVLHEIKRVMKKNGKCIVVVPNAETPISRLATQVIGYDGHAYHHPNTRKYWRHKSFFGYKKLMALIEKNGFEVLKTYGNVPHFPIVERIFNKGLLRKFYCALGDLNKKWSKDLIFICRKGCINPEME